MAEEKAISKTEAFKTELQRHVAEVTGMKISKQKAWELFKAFIKAPYEQIIATYEAAGKPAITYGAKLNELNLPLSGVGSFRIITVGGADNVSVKPRFYVSSSVCSEIKTALGFKAADVNEAADEPEAAELASDLDL